MLKEIFARRKVIKNWRALNRPQQNCQIRYLNAMRHSYHRIWPAKKKRTWDHFLYDDWELIESNTSCRYLLGFLIVQSFVLTTPPSVYYSVRLWHNLHLPSNDTYNAWQNMRWSILMAIIFVNILFVAFKQSDYSKERNDHLFLWIDSIIWEFLFTRE